MASEVPVCLIENAKGQMRPNKKTLEILFAITKPVVLVAIVGLCCTGKSYLMNQLAGKKTGTSEEDKNYNLPRFCIQKFFPRRKCFVFCPPPDWRKLSELESLHNEDLDSDFVQQANEVFQFFLKSQITIENFISQSENALTHKERAMAAEQAKKEAAEKELELMRQQQTEQEQAKEAQMRTLSENMAQLQKKMESERENQLREQERILDHNFKVLKELLHEGVGKQYYYIIKGETQQREKKD